MAGGLTADRATCTSSTSATAFGQNEVGQLHRRPAERLHRGVRLLQPQGRRCTGRLPGRWPGRGDAGATAPSASTTASPPTASSSTPGAAAATWGCQPLFRDSRERADAADGITVDFVDWTDPYGRGREGGRLRGRPLLAEPQAELHPGRLLDGLHRTRSCPTAGWARTAAPSAATPAGPCTGAWNWALRARLDAGTMT